ncbi:MAG TPA: zf-HC2 domain-containing protein [Rubrobacter sp.]|nr:zf-HC2 domain-containing protein [Rubrobacter sp.]
MTPPEEHYRYREQIGAFVLGKLDGGERKAIQTHLNSCPVCQAEVKELEPVVAALADAAPDRIEEDPRPPGDLEELTLAPILGEIHSARRRSRGIQWSALAAAAICVVAIGLAGLAWPLEPALSLESHLQERLSFSGEAPSMEVEGHLIAHAWGTEIRLIVSGMRDVQTHRVTLVSEDGERVNAGTFIGVGEKPLSLHLNAALLREDAAKLEVRTPGGELVCFDKLPEEPRVALFGIFPWPDQGPQNESTGPSAEDPPEKPKDDGSGSGTPHKGSSPESNDKGSSTGGDKPGAGPEESEPGGGLHESPPPDPPPPDGQYRAQP